MARSKKTRFLKKTRPKVIGSPQSIKDQEFDSLKHKVLALKRRMSSVPTEYTSVDDKIKVSSFIYNLWDGFKIRKWYFLYF